MFRDVLLPSCRPDGRPDEPGVRAHGAVGGRDDVRPRGQCVVDLRRQLGGRCGRDRRGEPGAALAGGPGRLSRQAGGVFVSGGSAANLSALVTARDATSPPRQPAGALHVRRHRGGARVGPRRGSGDGRRRAAGAHRRARPDDRRAGAALDARREHPDDATCSPSLPRRHHQRRRDRRTRRDRRRVRATRPVAARRRRLRPGRAVQHGSPSSASAASSAPTASASTRTSGCSPRTTVPRSCTATRRSRRHARQHGAYLDAVNRGDWNPSDYAYHLSRRARGLPLWFGLATYGTRPTPMRSTARRAPPTAFAAEVDAQGSTCCCRPSCRWCCSPATGGPSSSTPPGASSGPRTGEYLVVPTSWHGEPCLRICVVHPRTDPQQVIAILDDLAAALPREPPADRHGFPLRR
jgi:hypothetical protein